MNIAILSNSEAWGGLEMNTVRLANWLHATQMHAFSLVCAQNTKIAEEALLQNIPIISFEKKRLKRRNFIGYFKVYQQLKSHQIQYLIIGHSKDIELGVMFKKLSKGFIKIVYLQQMRVGVNKRDFYHTFFYNQLDAWIAPLHYLKEEVMTKTRLKPEKIHVIPLCIELEKFLAPKSQIEARNYFDLPQNITLAGIIGRLDAEKGQEYVIRALAEIRAKGYLIELMIMGDETKGFEGAYLPFLKELTQSLGLTEWVHFRPFNNNTPLAYAALDIFVLASLGEPFGMVTIEAMASQVAVIGTNNFGTKEIIQDGETGIYIEPQSTQSIADALEKLLIDAPLMKQIAQKAQADVKEKYSHTVQVEGVLRLLAGL